jgi:N-acetylmuramoyl-L-alanine amidase
MNFRDFILSCFAVGFVCVASSEPSPPHQSPIVKVFIDAGHGGRDDGARGKFGTLEKKISLELSKLVASKVKARRLNLEVRLSREDDKFLTLTERVTSANRWGADVFVSIHANSSPIPKVHGYEIYFLSSEASDDAAKDLAELENGETPKINSDVESILNDVQTNNHIVESSRFADVMFNAMSKSIAFGRAIRQAPFTVLQGTTMPALLIEAGYVTNKDDAIKLQRPLYLKRLADAISLGVINFVQRDVTYDYDNKTPKRKSSSGSTSSHSDHA